MRYPIPLVFLAVLLVSCHLCEDVEHFYIDVDLLPPGYVRCIRSEGAYLSYLGASGQLVKRGVAPQDQQLRFSSDPHSMIPVLLQLKGGGAPLGAIIWCGAPGPAHYPPFWTAPTNILESSPILLTPTVLGGFLAEVVLKVWSRQGLLSGLNLERLARRIGTRSLGDVRSVDMLRLVSDLSYGSFNSYSVRSALMKTVEFYLPPELHPQDNLVLSPLNPSSSLRLHLSQSGCARIEKCYPGSHRFRIPDRGDLIVFSTRLPGGRLYVCWRFSSL